MPGDNHYAATSPRDENGLKPPALPPTLLTGEVSALI